jgi:hypothetical protein
MLRKNVFHFIIFNLVSIFNAHSQQLDVTGDSRMRGKLDLMDLNQSIIVGNYAGIYNNGSSNSFFGCEAGELNNTGGVNSFFGHQAGLYNTSGSQNSFFGTQSGLHNEIGQRNSSFGAEAGSGNKIGNENSFFGAFAGFNSTGSDNAMFGADAGRNTTSGEKNTFMGYQSGYVNSTGFNNTFIGFKSGILNTEGDGNTALGYQSLHLNQRGFQNVGIGYEALYSNLTNYNTGIGTQVLYNTIDGQRNTAVGGFAGYNNDNAASTFIGYGTGSTTGVTNSTAIGYNAIVNANNKVRIGDDNILVIEGNVAFSPMSDRRLKENIKPVDLGLQFIQDLNPVMYHRIANENPDLEMGLIAQELDSVLIKYEDSKITMVNHGADGFLSVRYNDLFAPLIKAIQEQQEIINDQARSIKELSGEVLLQMHQQKSMEDKILDVNNHLESLVAQMVAIRVKESNK